MKWNSQQSQTLKSVDNWLREFYTKKSRSNQVFYLAGYAGTGKTTLAKHFAENVDEHVSFGAFTGKAALMMRQKGCRGASTIHSLIYKAHQNPDGTVEFFLNRNQSELLDAKLVIIDECSMVDEEMANDLLSFNKPILVLGDPAQLPPVTGAGYFTNGTPNMMLTEIHRQAADNPIIYLATEVRNGRQIDAGEYGESRVVNTLKTTDLIDCDQVLVGRNTTRTTLNMKMRKMLKFEGDEPNINEKLICLKNDKKLGIFNGGMFTVEHVLQNKYKTNFVTMRVKSDDFDSPPLPIKVHKTFFTDDIPRPDWRTLKGSQEMDYGYSITTHKSQGSQWDNVLVYDESWCFREHQQRWLYTAITRAAEKVTILKS